jgi:quercetin dioxygenase-like cupin family protein
VPVPVEAISKTASMGFCDAIFVRKIGRSVGHPGTKIREMEKRMKKMLYGICLVLLLLGNAWAVDAENIETTLLAKTGSSWDGRHLPDYPNDKPEITILRIKILPGAQLPLHCHPVINAGVMMAGELTVVTEDKKTLHLKAGDPIVEVVNTWHYGKNEGSIPAEIIVFYAGTKGNPITLKK